METINLKPSEIIPTADGRSTPALENLAELWQELDVDVIELPANNPLRQAFNASYVILKGNDARVSAQQSNVSLNANVLGPSDHNYDFRLEQATQMASIYYEGYF
jgi:hypothetical protein